MHRYRIEIENVISKHHYDELDQWHHITVKPCLHYHTCTAYMYALHV